MICYAYHKTFNKYLFAIFLKFCGNSSFPKMISDIRYNNFDDNPDNYSRDWSQFVGPSYIPVVSEWEENSFKQLMTNMWWMRHNWHYSIIIATIYIILIPILKTFVRIRGKQYQLRVPLIIWNAAMASFSILGVIRCLPQFIQIVTTKDLTASYCQAGFYLDVRLQVWYWAFIMSKVPELFDTLFIVLRGGKLIYLHWIHHALTLCYCWFAYGDIPATAQWMVNMNFIVHSFMYTHYALSAMRFKVPVAIRVSITSLQIIQMAFGIYIHVAVVVRKVWSQPCDVSFRVSLAGLALYTLFIVLFTNYFIMTYVIKNKKVKTK